MQAVPNGSHSENGDVGNFPFEEIQVAPASNNHNGHTENYQHMIMQDVKPCLNPIIVSHTPGNQAMPQFSIAGSMGDQGRHTPNVIYVQSFLGGNNNIQQASLSSSLSMTNAVSQIQTICEDEAPQYVNAKQYHRILKRREQRAKLERQGRLPKSRQKYLYESRHLHAINRQRAKGGKFGVSSSEDSPTAEGREQGRGPGKKARRKASMDDLSPMLPHSPGGGGNSSSSLGQISPETSSTLTNEMKNSSTSYFKPIAASTTQFVPISAAFPTDMMIPCKVENSTSSQVAMGSTFQLMIPGNSQPIFVQSNKTGENLNVVTSVSNQLDTAAVDDIVFNGGTGVGYSTMQYSASDTAVNQFTFDDGKHLEYVTLDASNIPTFDDVSRLAVDENIEENNNYFPQVKPGGNDCF